jgi:hypothetical protein
MQGKRETFESNGTMKKIIKKQSREGLTFNRVLPPDLFEE